MFWDLGFLKEGIAESPSKRLSLDKLSERLVKAKEWSDTKKVLDRVRGNPLPRNRRRGKNNLFGMDSGRKNNSLNQWQKEDDESEDEDDDDDDDDDEYAEIVNNQTQKPKASVLG